MDITDYKELFIETWCTDTSTVSLGLTSRTSAWLYENTGPYVQQSVKGGPESPDHIQCNISSNKGEWYLSIQRLYTNSTKYNFCNINGIRLYGITYSYTNRGI